MINLHTRAFCDECGSPAVVETGAGLFLCARCDSITPAASQGVNAPTAGLAPSAVGATLSVSDGVLSSSRETETEPSATLASAPSEFSSGDGLGIQQPGSITWGGREPTPAPSGRARDRAKCPAVTGNSSCGGVESRHATDSVVLDPVRFGEVAGETTGQPEVASGPQDSIPNAVRSPNLPLTGPETSAARSEKEASSLSLSSHPGPRGLDFEAEVSALDAQWLRAGISLASVAFRLKNSTSFASRALDSISANFVQDPPSSSTT
jgi:hypothetical protein